jgi:hypothetical protein
VSVVTMENNGAVAYAARRLAAGASPADIIARLRLDFPGESPSSYLAVVTRGQAALDVGEQLDLGGAQDFVYSRNIPGLRPGHAGYRYYVLLTVRDVMTGLEDTREVQVYSIANLSQEDVLAEAWLAMAQILSGSRRGRSPKPGIALWDRVSRQILAIERD